MVRLSERLLAIAALVTPGGVLADVGTDHAYVPIALMQQNKIRAAIALDVRKDPLARAAENIREAGLQEYIVTRLSDGTAALAVHEADSILIAGMGGELMIRILSDGWEVCGAAGELILQPQSEIHRVRAFLRGKGCRIFAEDMILEDGKYYQMFRAVPDAGEETTDPERTEVCDYYGPLLLEQKNPVLRRFLGREHGQLLSLLETLRAQEKTDAIACRIAQVQKEIRRNETANLMMGENTNAGI